MTFEEWYLTIPLEDRRIIGTKPMTQDYIRLAWFVRHEIAKAELAAKDAKLKQENDRIIELLGQADVLHSEVAGLEAEIDRLRKLGMSQVDDKEALRSRLERAEELLRDAEFTVLRSSFEKGQEIKEFLPQAGRKRGGDVIPFNDLITRMLERGLIKRKHIQIVEYVWAACNANIAELEERLNDIREYEPTEVCYDEFACKRLVEAYRKVATLVESEATK